MTDYFTEIMVMDLPHSDKALSFLFRIAEDVEPLMRNHNWKVPLLVEYFDPTRLGTNAYRGEKISIRLRETTDGADFYPYSEVLDTMLHELAHNEYDGHGQDFYDFLEQLRVEHRNSHSSQFDPVPVYHGSSGGSGFPVASPYGGYYDIGGSDTYGGFGDYGRGGTSMSTYGDYGEGGASNYGDHGEGGATTYGNYGEGGAISYGGYGGNTTYDNYGGTTTYGDYGEGGATTYGDYGGGRASTTERDYGETMTTYGNYGGTSTTYGDYGDATATYGDYSQTTTAYGADGATSSYYGQTTTYGDDGEATASYGDYGTATTYGDYAETNTSTYGRSGRNKRSSRSRTKTKGQNCVIC